jgi:hypothetical protein
LSILWIKSSLSTILPCLPGLAFTENIKNLHLSEGSRGAEEERIEVFSYHYPSK